MKIFLLWHRNTKLGRDLDPERVASSLQEIFSPLFHVPPPARAIQNSVAGMAFLELPVRGWKPAFFQEDERNWAFSVDYPFNARSALKANGLRYTEDNVLPALGRAFEGDPTPLLREMSPPFSLIWSSKRTDETFVQNDGLGQTQLFEYEDGKIWALTNKIAALKALGISPELERDDWAVRCTLGSFALDATGFKNTRYLRSATQLRLDTTGVYRSKYDVVSDWVNPSGLSRDDCLELARSSLQKQIQEVMPFWEKPVADLTGGWDTRAVVSSLRAANAEFSLNVKGLPGKFDVAIASELAKKAGLDLKIMPSAELPPDNAEACRRCISRALLWQTGYMWTIRQKSFLWEQEYLDGGAVNIMGHHAAIGKGGYARKIRASELREDQYEDRLVQLVTGKKPMLTKKVLHEPIREVIRNAYRQADEYGLVGLARLDFWFLYERNRRYNGASITSQTGLVFAPFMNPDYIRASYAYRALGGEFHNLRTPINPLHRRIIETHAPEWVNVPYERELMKKAKKEKRKNKLGTPDQQPIASSDWKLSDGKDYYNYALYWKVIGKPIIDEALAEGGFWTEIFDPDLVRKEWDTAADDIAMLHLMPSLV